MRRRRKEYPEIGIYWFGLYHNSINTAFLLPPFEKTIHKKNVKKPRMEIRRYLVGICVLASD
jgi:hypothetical protein